ncbi:Type I inositol 1,4,5-trisphosphate 5-phosphatase, partial [Varanus komodoensis]
MATRRTSVTDEVVPVLNHCPSSIMDWMGANKLSLNPDKMDVLWVVHAHKPHFMALHCQEFGGKNYEASMSHVDKFV